MAETHLNAFKAHAKETLDKVHAAVQEADAALEELFAKLDADLTPTPDVPVAPATDDSTKVEVKTDKK